MKYLATLFICLSAAVCLHGQTYYGIIIDASTGQPLPYVNVGINGKDMGVLSNEAGLFEIDLTHAAAEDSLYITHVGYDLEVIPLNELKGGDIGIRLYHRDYYLREVNIGGLRMQNKEKFGRLQPSKTTTVYERTAGVGAGKEWGLKIDNQDERYLLQDLNFHLKENTADSALFRLNIYSLYNGMPDESILRDPIFIKSYKRDKWVSGDLSSQNVIIDEPVIVALEVVQTWSQDSEMELQFSIGQGYESGGTYSRSSSFAEWQINEHPPLTLYLTGRIF